MSTTEVNTSCLFCRIVKGSIPSHKVYEDDAFYSFMDINPLSKGHCLVIPKHHAQKLHELPPSAVTNLGPVLVKVANAVVKGTGFGDYNLVQNNGKTAGQEVDHVHFHIIPKDAPGKGLNAKLQPSAAEDKDPENLKSTAAAIAANL